MRIINLSLLIILLTVISSHTFAQLSWNLDTESGLFLLNNNTISTETEWGASLNGDLKYKIKSDNRLAVFNIRAKPELYDISDNLLTLKLKASAEYYQIKDNLSWAIKINAEKFNYYLSGRNFYNSSIILIGEISPNIFEGLQSSFRAGYSNRSIFTEDDLTMDLAFADAFFYHQIIPSFSIGYGLYIEKFRAKNLYQYYSQADVSNRGIRYGPQLSLILNSDFVIRGMYNFLIHDSEETEPISYEQQLSFIMGKNIFEDFSVLIFLNYYSGRLKDKDGQAAGRLYFRADYENTVYLKLSYDLSDIVEIYLKPGYRNIELSNYSGSLKEWHFLFGIGLAN
jgi:hypothetical protein